MKITFKDEAALHRWIVQNDPFWSSFAPPCYSAVWKLIFKAKPREAIPPPPPRSDKPPADPFRKG